MPTIRKRGAKWQAQVRIKKEGVVVYNTSASFDTEREASRWAHALEDRISKVGVEAHYTQTSTIKEIVSAWYGYRETQGEPSRGIQHSAKALLMSPFANKSSNQLTAQDLTSWGMSLRQRLDPATVLHHFMVLRSAFVSCEAVMGFKPDLSKIEAAMDALKRTRVIAKSRSRTQRINDAELKLLVEVFKSQASRVIPMWDYVLLAVALPRRREELLTMKWSDYDGQTIVLRDTKHPTHPRDEVVPVPELAQEIINRQPRYPGEARILPYKPNSVSAAFQRAVRTVNLGHIRLHDLRHEGISRLFEQGLAIQEVSLISGHTSWAALKRYTQITPLFVLEKLNAGKSKAQKAAAQPEAAGKGDDDSAVSQGS